jgi:serine/threonine protein kinase
MISFCLSTGYTVNVPRHFNGYRFERIIGAGSYAVVLQASDESSGTPYAVKVTSKKYLIDQGEVSRFEREVTLFSSFEHPNIVQFHEILHDDNLIYIVMEYCDLGSLHTHLLREGAASEAGARFIVGQILSALVYLHGRGISHRDLKPDNIIIKTPMTVKIADFGFAVSAQPNALVSTQCGSPAYTAPEVVAGQPYDGRAADMWSLGVIAYAIVAGQLPWRDVTNQKNLFFDIQTARYHVPDEASPTFANFVGGLMQPQPILRFTVEQAQNHPWLREKSEEPKGLPFGMKRRIMQKAASGEYLRTPVAAAAMQPLRMLALGNNKPRRTRPKSRSRRELDD